MSRNLHHYNYHYEKDRYDCQNSDNPCFSTCICYFLVKSVIIGWMCQPFTKLKIPHEWSPEKIYEIILKSTVLHNYKQDYRNVSHSPKIFRIPHFFGSGFYFFFRFTDFQLCPFLFVTGLCFCLFHLFLCFFLFLLCFIYCFNR